MRLLLVGDTHANIQWMRDRVFPYAVDNGCDRIVQLGDFGYWPHTGDFHEHVADLVAEHNMSLYWLDGNHENFDALHDQIDRWYLEPQEVAAGVFYMPRGTRLDWDGVNLLVLGGGYSIDKMYRVDRVSWWHQETITEKDVGVCLEQIEDCGPVDVMLTHDAPDGITIGGEHAEWKTGYAESEANRKAVGEVMRAARPRLLVHGHYHCRYETSAGDTHVVGLGRDGDLGAFYVLDTDQDVS